MRSAAAQMPDPAEMLAALNDQLQERKLAAQYVTMLMAVWDDATQTLTLANAGSVQPLYVTRDTQSLTNALAVSTLELEGFPLGLFPDVTYDQLHLATEPGDVVVFISDGITDAEGDDGEMYGDQRLTSLLCSVRDLPAVDIADSILADVARFQGSHDRFDDETIIVLRVR
jgi:sigma-B regulation protein RsbU (phosphoserine phosphatase)